LCDASLSLVRSRRPLNPIPTTIQLPLHISKVPVHGKVTATAVLSSADGKEVMCLEIVTKL